MSETTQARPVTIAIVGAGHRSVAYARYALRHPDRMKVVAVADPDAMRRDKLADAHGVPAAMRFASYEQYVDRPGAAPLADAVINGTMDKLHYVSTMPLLKAGYHVLLEKPIACTEREVRELIEVAGRHKRIVMICHVLRYAPFYVRIKQLVDEGAIGEVVTLHTSENVSYHHMAVAFVRGRWNNEEASNPMLLAKCCHDLDIIAWLMSGQAIRRVASFGSLRQFRKENAPAGATARCLDGCAVEATCAYSARTNHITQGLWRDYAFEHHPDYKTMTEQEMLDSLRDPKNRYGRCVWHCDNDVVDHQNVIVEFANGATASHDMLCATSRATRTIHIVGTRGELQGDLETGLIDVLTPKLGPGERFEKRTIDVKVEGGGVTGGHGGGDERLIGDFVALLRGEQTSRGHTRIEDSLAGHVIAFAADRSRKEGRVVEVA